MFLYHLRHFSTPASLPAALRTIAPGTSPSAAYETLVRVGVLRSDSHQRSVLPLLDAVHTRVVAVAGSRLSPAPLTPPPPRSLPWSWGGGAAPAALAPPPPSPPGLYLHGGTGCGKTLLMDIFFSCAPAHARARRVHFHAFMQGVNARLHAARVAGVRGDPLGAVARELGAEAWLLCFDEVQVTDVGDALILRRLFDALYSEGLVMVATSNRAPLELYAGGLQRDLFLPFVRLLRERCTVHHLQSPTDHRLLGAAAAGRGAPRWLCPAPGLPAAEAAAAAASVTAAFDRAWAAASAAGDTEVALALPVEGQGRALRVARALPAARAARLTFAELCGAPLYAGDYAALARGFGHVYLEGVPLLGMGERNELRRLITLVDVLYDARVRLTVSASAPPAATFSAGEGAKAMYDEVYAWDRCVSRLSEMMQGEEWERKASA
jgi:predicted ATPase